MQVMLVWAKAELAWQIWGTVKEGGDEDGEI